MVAVADVGKRGEYLDKSEHRMLRDAKVAAVVDDEDDEAGPSVDC